MLYLLERKTKVMYDQTTAMVIRAKSYKDARAEAALQATDEGPSVWLDPHLSTCLKIATAGVRQCILGSFRAG